MINLKDASKISTQEIDALWELIEAKFESIDYDPAKSQESFYIKCNNGNTFDKIKDIIIRFIPDMARQKPKLPRNLKEYYKEGGGESLVEKFSNANREAWKCEVFSNLTDGKRLEYGVSINENNFSQNQIKSLLNQYLIE